MLVSVKITGMKNTQTKIILAIESSCDETSAAVMQKQEEGVTLLSNIIASSLEIQAKYGGVVPEQAAREQLKSIIPVTIEALEKAGVSKKDLDAIAVTEGPGLIGSLLIGVEFAKTLAAAWQKPLVPVNHLIGHFYANWIKEAPEQPIPNFPAVGLLVSGGHSDIVLMKDHGQYEYLGGTRDDAAGECFDKTARLMNLHYPGGPNISRLAKNGNSKAFRLPRPMINSGDFDFSFSGLKTAVANLIQSNPEILADQRKLADLAASVEMAIVDVLVKKTIKAAKSKDVKQIIVAGGVAANEKLREVLQTEVERNIPGARVFIPPVKLCTDNAGYIGAAAFYNYYPQDPDKIEANPNLSLSH